MKIVIFGATGKTGLEIIEQAIEEGHEVTAFVRNRAQLNGHDDNTLNVVVGDALDAEAVEKAIVGQDIVLSALGARVGQKVGVVRSEGTRNIVNAMQKHNVQRLIAISTIGIGDTPQRMSGFTHFVLRRIIGQERLAEAELQEQIVTDSPLAWTLVRPPRLVNGAVTHSYDADPLLHTGFSASLRRADLADFMLQQTTSDRFVRQHVTVVN